MQRRAGNKMAGNDLATESQIRKLYAVLHSLGIEPKEFKKERNIASYERLTRRECSEYITELEEQEAKLKGTVEEQKSEPEQPNKQAGLNNPEPETAHIESEISKLGDVMQFAAREAVRITKEEVEGNIDNQGLAGFVKDLAIGMFREYRRQEERA
jgi:hypothetical protein